jgi:hypothetical protein
MVTTSAPSSSAVASAENELAVPAPLPNMLPPAPPALPNKDPPATPADPNSEPPVLPTVPKSIPLEDALSVLAPPKSGPDSLPPLPDMPLDANRLELEATAALLANIEPEEG